MSLRLPTENRTQWPEMPKRNLEPDADILVGHCKHCGEPIYEGAERYYYIDEEGIFIESSCFVEYAKYVLNAEYILN